MAKKRAVLSGIGKGEGRLTGPSGTYEIYTEERPPCMEACPAGVDIKAYVNLIADRRYEDAVQVVRRANPFPGICGRVCTHPCEAECGRKDIDQPVSIKTLKRFAADYELSRKKENVAPDRSRSERIAIIGSGPAGLTAAADLALAGFPVTVFERSTEAGGLMSWGIPDFRLPKNIVRSEVRDIRALGVEILTGRKVERPIELLKEGFSAVILATGCQAPMLAGIPGESGKGVIDCLDFLMGVSEKKISRLAGRTLVIGGGNAALDSARTSLRLGSAVTIAYRRTEEQMPAGPEEIAHAKDEGIKFEFLAIPIEIMPGRAVKFQRARLGEPDDSGRRSSVPVPGEFFELHAENVIMAIGSNADVSAFPGDMRKTKLGTPEVDENRMTSIAGLFAAGDIATGPSTIVDAIGGGHDAAAGVIRFLLGEKAPADGPVGMLVVESALPDKAARCGTCFIPIEARRSTFDEVEIGPAEREAITEALRCRRCGSCTVCEVCLAVCDYRNAAVSIEDGESVLAKVPFSVARDSVSNPDGWKLRLGGKGMTLTIEPFLACADRDTCIACGKCEEACPYKAIRTVFDMAGNATARVEESACRGCGACVAACPTGSMTIGYMGDAGIRPRLAEAVRDSRKNDHVIVLSCIWNSPDAALEGEPWEVRLQCTRRVSPAILMEALAMGAKAVLVRGCGEESCHYLPGPWMGPDVVESCREMLRAICVNPERISYAEADKPASQIADLNPFKSMADKLPECRSGLGRCLNAIQALMAQPDEEPAPAAKGRALLGLGCLAMSEPAFTAYGIQQADVLGAIQELLANSGIQYDVAADVHTPGAGLKEWGMDRLHKSYTGRMLKTLKQSKPETFMMATPKSYESFRKMELPCPVATLPSALAKAMAGRFPETREIVAYHPACSGGGEFDNDCLKLLGLVPGLKVVRSEGKCGDTGWKNVDAGSRKSAVALLKAAEAEGATIIVTGSTRCAAHLHAVTGGWCTSPVKVMDIYSFMASMLRGDE